MTTTTGTGERQPLPRGRVSSPATNGQLRLELRPRPPYRLDLTVWALRRRNRNAMDRWDGSYQRAVVSGGRAVGVRVTQHGTFQRPVLAVELRATPPCTKGEISDVLHQVRGLLGVDVDLRRFHALAAANPTSKALVAGLAGVRPPKFPTLFEALSNAVANQQLSLEVGLTLLNRLTESHGMVAPGFGSESQGLRAFPDAHTIMAATTAELRTLGFSSRKADYLRGLAEAVATGVLTEDELRPVDRGEATRRLMALRGIGRWSAEYVLLRGLGRLDVYPGDDVGARTKLRRFMNLDHDPDYDEIAALLEPWNPCAGMLYFCLLLDGLRSAGELASTHDVELG